MKKFFKNTSGTILFTVLILTIILSVVVIGIMSLNVSQVRSSQTVIDELKAEYLAQGHFYRYHQAMVSSGGAVLPSNNLTLDGKIFQLTSSNAIGIFDTEQVDVDLQF